MTVQRLLIFDRWGGQLFSGKDFPAGDVRYGWDGTRKGQPLDAGVYVFYAELELPGGAVRKIEGEVTLIR